MKRKNSLCILALVCAGFLMPFTGIAQVTIGSGETPAKAALLDVKEQNATDGDVTATKGGIILPRVRLVNLNDLAPFISGGGSDEDKTTHKGMVVYNLTDDTTFKPGIYYWDGNEWYKSQDDTDRIEYSGSTSITILANNEIRRKALTGDVEAPANNNTLTIKDGAVKNEKIADNAVTSSKIEDGTVGTDDLSDNSVTTDKIAYNTIVNDDIADTTILAAKLKAQGEPGQILTISADNSAPIWADAPRDSHIPNLLGTDSITLRGGSGAYAIYAVSGKLVTLTGSFFTNPRVLNSGSITYTFSPWHTEDGVSGSKRMIYWAGSSDYTLPTAQHSQQGNTVGDVIFPVSDVKVVWSGPQGFLIAPL